MKYILCSHLRSWVMVVPRKRKERSHRLSWTGRRVEGKDPALRGTGADGPGVRDTCCFLLDMKSVIHLKMESGTLS